MAGAQGRAADPERLGSARAKVVKQDVSTRRQTIERRQARRCLQVEPDRALATVEHLKIDGIAVVERTPIRRPSSLPSTRSILSTSAPKSAKITPPNGPARTWPSSNTRNPDRIPADGAALVSIVVPPSLGRSFDDGTRFVNDGSLTRVC